MPLVNEFTPGIQKQYCGNRPYFILLEYWIIKFTLNSIVPANQLIRSGVFNECFMVLID